MEKIVVEISDAWVPRGIYRSRGEKIIQFYKDLINRVNKATTDKSITEIEIEIKTGKPSNPNLVPYSDVCWVPGVDKIVNMMRGKTQKKHRRWQSDDFKSIEPVKNHTTFNWIYDWACNTIKLKKKSKLKKRCKLDTCLFPSPIYIVRIDVEIHSDGELNDPNTSNIEIIGKVLTNTQSGYASSEGKCYRKVKFDIENNKIYDIYNGRHDEIENIENLEDVFNEIKKMMGKIASNE